MSETLGQLSLSGRYDARELEGNGFRLTAWTAEAQVLSVLFQFERASRRESGVLRVRR